MATQTRGPRTMLFTVIKTLLFLYVVLGVLIYIFQGKLLFMPTGPLLRTPEIYGWDFEDVQLEVDGHTTHGWYVPAPGERRGVILFSHGNAGNIGDRLESITLFRQLGLDVLAYDYGGYGRSTGRPSEQRCYKDIRAMWRYLTEERKVPPGEIVLFGRSLGAGVTCQLATEVEAAAVILESSFLSVAQMAQELYRVYPANLMTRHRFDNESKIGKLKSPLLQVHSPGDTLIPYRHGQRLHELAPNPKTFLQIQGDHNEGFWISGNQYTDGLNAFLSPLLDPGDSPDTSGT